MPRYLILIALLIASVQLTNGRNPSEKQVNEIISVVNIDEGHWQSFLYDAQLFENRIDTFRKVNFWTLVMNTSDKLMIINEAQSRRILEIVPRSRWAKWTDEEKEDYRCGLRQEFSLAEDCRIFATEGKEEFYQFKKVMPTVDRGIHVFLENKVDPWYAQAILLIESPGHMVRSPDGAFGSFQLMKKVARKFGLRVDATVDERKDFDRSAYAASKLIETICLPYTREMLVNRGMEIDESALWFRLLVLHVYHAGAYNVRNALDLIEPEVQGLQLIKNLWETEAKGFKNASQNYTQVALASLLRLDELIHEQCVIYHSTDVPFQSLTGLPVKSEVAKASSR